MERKGREETAGKLDETRAHVRSLQGEAAQCRRREAAAGRTLQDTEAERSAQASRLDHASAGGN